MTNGPKKTRRSRFENRSTHSSRQRQDIYLARGSRPKLAISPTQASISSIQTSLARGNTLRIVDSTNTFGSSTWDASGDFFLVLANSDQLIVRVQNGVILSVISSTPAA